MIAQNRLTQNALPYSSNALYNVITSVSTSINVKSEQRLKSYRPRTAVAEPACWLKSRPNTNEVAW